MISNTEPFATLPTRQLKMPLITPVLNRFLSITIWMEDTSTIFYPTLIYYTALKLALSFESRIPWYHPRLASDLLSIRGGPHISDLCLSSVGIIGMYCHARFMQCGDGAQGLMHVGKHTIN